MVCKSMQAPWPWLTVSKHGQSWEARLEACGVTHLMQLGVKAASPPGIHLGVVAPTCCPPDLSLWSTKCCHTSPFWDQTGHCEKLFIQQVRLAHLLLLNCLQSVPQKPSSEVHKDAYKDIYKGKQCKEAPRPGQAARILGRQLSSCLNILELPFHFS